MPAKSWLVLIVALLLGELSCTQQPRPQAQPQVPGRVLRVKELGGGSIVTDLGYRIQVNQGSSLQRRWFVINDPSCPVQLSGAGIRTAYRSSSIGGDYKYMATGLATTGEMITAFQVRYLLFDIWGEHTRTLSDTEVSDLKAQIALKDTGSWSTWENEVSEFFTVVSFVSLVRRPDGTVWQYDPSSLLQHVEGIKVKLTEKELTPDREKPKN